MNGKRRLVASLLTGQWSHDMKDQFKSANVLPQVLQDSVLLYCLFVIVIALVQVQTEKLSLFTGGCCFSI